jgi:hypothetical protein
MPLNKSYDFRQNLGAQIKHKNLKLELPVDIEDASNEESGKAKIIFNNR